MVRTKIYKLKDGSFIQETEKGCFAVVFPNKRCMIITTWEGKVKVNALGFGNFEMGECSQVVAQ
jgi:hypothetical protein